MVKLLVGNVIQCWEGKMLHKTESEYKKLWWQKVFKFHKSYPFAHS